MAYDGTLKFDTSIDPGGFQDGIDKISGIAEKGLKATGAILTGAATAIGTISAASIKVGSDFEAQMSRVQAISGATGKEFEALKDQALQLGADTAFSAQEAAEGMENLASAGFNTSEIMDAMPGMMDLAASSGESLAASSEIAASTLRAFGMEASEAGHIADVLAQNAANTNAAVYDTGEAMKYIAPVAASMGIEFEECAAAIGILADNGIKGSQAGTTLRGALTRLAKPTEQMEKVMAKLGVSFYDSEGNMVSLAEQVNILRKATAGLTNEQRDNYLATLYGQEALSGMLALINSEEGKIEDLTKAYEECDGAAAKMAETMQDNLKSQVEQVQGAMESLGVSIYEKLCEPLKDAAKEANVMMDELLDAFENNGFEGLVTTAGKCFADIVDGAAKVAPKLVNTARDLVESFADGIIENKNSLSESGAEIVISLASAIISASGNIWTAAVELFAGLLSGISSRLPELAPVAEEAISEFGTALINNAPTIGSASAKIISFLASSVLENIPEIIETGKEIVRGLIDGVEQELPGLGAFFSGFFDGFASTLGTSAQVIIDAIELLFESLNGADPVAMEVLGKAIGTIAASMAALKVASSVVGGVKTLLSVLSGFGKSVGTVIGIVPKVIEGFQLIAGGAGTFGEVLALEFPKIAAFVAKVSGVFAKVGGIATKTGAVFAKIASAASSAISTLGNILAPIAPMIAGIGSVIGGMALAVSNFISMLTDGFDWLKEALMVVGVTIATVGAVVLGAPAAIAAAVAGIITAIGTLVVVIKDNWNSIVEFFKSLPEKIGQAVDSVAEWFSKLPGKIKTAFDSACDKAREFAENIKEQFLSIKDKAGEWLNKTVETVVEWGAEMLASAKETAGKVVTAVAQFFEELPYKIGYALGVAIVKVIQWTASVHNWVTTEVPKIIDNIANWFSELPGKIWIWLTDVVTKVIQWGTNLKNQATTWVQNTVSSIVQFFSELPGKIWTWLVDVVNKVVQWGVDLKNQAVTWVTSTISSIVQYFSELPGKIWIWLTDVINKVIQWGLDLLNQCTTAAMNAINAIVSWFSQLPGKIWTWLQNVITKVKQWAVDLADKGRQAAEALTKAVLDGVRGLPDKMREVGSNIVQGVWNGIQSAKDWFVSKVSDFFSGIVDGVKDTLGINSPSRVMKKEVGRWLPPGVGEGVEEAMPDLYDQTDREMEKLAEHMRATVEVETGTVTVRSKAKAEHTAQTEMPRGGDTYIEEKVEQHNNYYTPVATPSEVSKQQRKAARDLLGGVK